MEFTFNNSKYTIRELTANDINPLSVFLESLSTRTKDFYDEYNDNSAKEIVDAIGKYDKLRYVIEADEGIIGIVEFSMDFTEGDINRYSGYGIEINKIEDCRFGICLRDDMQGRGVGDIVFEKVREILQSLGKKRVILWGGVLKINTNAIKYYSNNGFRLVGEFNNEDGESCLDMICEIK